MPKTKDDPRNVPIYSIPEAAHYLSIPSTTLRAWVLGTSYGTGENKRQFLPVIRPPAADRPLLSFYNLAEAHVLRALRTEHKVNLGAIRRTLNYVRNKKGFARPLIEERFLTDGATLFIDHLGQLIDASADGQVAMRDVLNAHLRRLRFDGDTVERLFPVTRSDPGAGPLSVFIDPRFAFGRPLLSESGVTTTVVAERYRAGDSIADLAKDYGCSSLEIEEGLRYELRLNIAA